MAITGICHLTSVRPSSTLSKIVSHSPDPQVNICGWPWIVPDTKEKWKNPMLSSSLLL